MRYSPDRHRCVEKLIDGDTAVLFVHGIQGSPCQFHFLTDSLPDNVSFRNLLLPGHGAGHRAFRDSGIDDWQNAVIEAAADLRSKYKRVFYVGHSMGCLLGLMAVCKGGIKFDGMLLLACPLKLRFTLRYLSHNYLTVFLPNCKNIFMQASVEANSISAKYPLQYFSCIHPYIELLRLIKRVRSAMCDTGCEVKAVHFAKDEIVSERSLEMLKSIADLDTYVYPGCGHNYFRELAGPDICEMLFKMIDR